MVKIDKKIDIENILGTIKLSSNNKKSLSQVMATITEKYHIVIKSIELITEKSIEFYFIDNDRFIVKIIVNDAMNIVKYDIIDQSINKLNGNYSSKYNDNHTVKSKPNIQSCKSCKSYTKDNKGRCSKGFKIFENIDMKKYCNQFSAINTNIKNEKDKNKEVATTIKNLLNQSKNYNEISKLINKSRYDSFKICEQYYPKYTGKIDKNKAQELWKLGLSFEEIANFFCVNRANISKLLNTKEKNQKKSIPKNNNTTISNPQIELNIKAKCIVTEAVTNKESTNQGESEKILKDRANKYISNMNTYTESKLSVY